MQICSQTSQFGLARSFTDSAPNVSGGVISAMSSVSFLYA
jgi:hypothetical protein